MEVFIFLYLWAGATISATFWLGDEIGAVPTWFYGLPLFFWPLIIPVWVAALIQHKYMEGR